MRLRIAALIALAAACSSGERESPTAGDTGGTLLVALPVEPRTLMPLFLSAAQEKEIADQVFDVLAEIGPDLNTFGDAGWTPRLAKSWAWAPDSLSIAFTLDPAAKWHDGRPVSSADVRFSVDLFKDPAVGARLAGAFADVDSVTAPDSLTAVVWYSRRSPEQFYNVAWTLLVMPEHLLRDAERSSLATHPFGRNPIGSGPFRFVRWDARAAVVVEADTSYHLGRPLLDRVIWILTPDPNAAMTNVLAGDVDVFETVTTDGMARIAGQDLVRAVPYSSPNYGYLGFNYVDPKNPGRPHPLFADRELRRALSMALDRSTLVKNVYDSLAWVAVGPFSRMLNTADTTLGGAAYDSAGASALLDSLGWRDTDNDGVRDKGGRPLRFGVMFPSSSVPRQQFAELIQAQLKAHGVQVDVDATDFTAMGPRVFSSQFDVLLNNWVSDPSPSALRENWRSVPPARRGSNFQLYANPRVDSALDLAIVEADDARRRAHYREAYRRLIDDHAAIWLYENRPFMALNRRVQPVLRGRDAWWRHLRLWSIAADQRLPRDAR